MDRARLFFKVMFLLNALLGTADGIFLLLQRYPDEDGAAQWRPAAVTLLTAVSGLGWFVFSKGPLRERGARWVDRGTTLALALGYAWVTVVLSAPGEQEAVYFALILIALVLVLRASLVPSSAADTTIVGILSMGAFLLMCLETLGRNTPVAFFFWIGALGCVFVTATTVMSRTIYALKEQNQTNACLGNYELEWIRRGTGTLYLGRHLLLNRKAVLKRLTPDPLAEERQRPWQQGGPFNHPANVPPLDLRRTPDGLSYMISEYVRGVDLGKLVRLCGPLPSARVELIAEQLAWYLCALQRTGLSHGSIQPSHLLLGPSIGDGEVLRVINLGVSDDPLGSTLETALPEERLLFCAPELLLDPTCNDQRSDVYAFGAVLFFLLSGNPPFEGATAREVVGKKLNAGSRPLEADHPWAPLLQKCLDGIPEHRPTVEDLLGELRALRTTPRAWTRAEAEVWWTEHEGLLEPSPHAPMSHQGTD